MSSLGARFRTMHESGCFLIPNPWDIGSAKLFEHLGFTALATTSSAFAATLGRHDQHVGIDELVDHVADLCAAVDVPVNVDFEWGYAGAADGLAGLIGRLAQAGAAGFSLEDFDPARGAVVGIDEAADRVAAGAAAAAAHGLVFTARCENFLHDRLDIDDTIARLERYGEAGADVLYAPGAHSPDAIARIVAIGLPVNVLALPGAPTIAEITELGARRVSTGGALGFVAYGAAVQAARELLTGSTDYLTAMLTPTDRQAFD